MIEKVTPGTRNRIDDDSFQLWRVSLAPSGTLVVTARDNLKLATEKEASQM